MVAGPLKRADEIGFQLSFDPIILLLVFRRELFIRDGLGNGFLGTGVRWDLIVSRYDK